MRGTDLAGAAAAKRAGGRAADHVVMEIGADETWANHHRADTKTF